MGQIRSRITSIRLFSAVVYKFTVSWYNYTIKGNVFTESLQLFPHIAVLYSVKFNEGRVMCVIEY